MSEWDSPIPSNSNSNSNSSSNNNSGTSTPNSIRPKKKKGIKIYLNGSAAPSSERSHRLPSWNQSSLSSSSGSSSSLVRDELKTGNSRMNSGSNSSFSKIGLNLKSSCLICDNLVYYPRNWKNEDRSTFECDVCGTLLDLDEVNEEEEDDVDSNEVISLENLNLEDESYIISTKEFIERSFKNLNSINKSFQPSSSSTSTSNLPSFQQISKFYSQLLTHPELINLLRNKIEGILTRPGNKLPLENCTWIIILFECPIFTAEYTPDVSKRSWLIARLLGLISNLPNEQHHLLVNYLSSATYPTERLREKIEMVTSFTSSRIGIMFDLNDFEDHRARSLEEGRDNWGVMSGSKIGALLATANSNSNSQIPLAFLYCTVIDLLHSDRLLDLFDSWENGIDNDYSIFHYPHLLSLGIKIKLLAYDGQRQMEELARKASRSTYYTNQDLPESERPFLLLKIRRQHLITDSLQQLSENSHQLKKNLKIQFLEEEGIDIGGILKEWLLLLVRQLFDPQFGMFLINKESRNSYFNPSSLEDLLNEFYLVGQIIGLAIYNQVTLDVPLPSAVYKKLRGEMVNLKDLEVLDPELAAGFQSLLDFEEKGDETVENTFCRTFVGEYESWGEMIEVELVESGKEIVVTVENRIEYVRLYVDFILNTSISSQYESFEKGFLEIVAGNALSLFKGEELELLVKGSPEPLDLHALELVTTYDGFNTKESQDTIRIFWKTLITFTTNQQRSLLHFITGSDRTPAIGTPGLKLRISNLGIDLGRYPSSHTCFNQLKLYEYETEERMKEMLIGAMEESEGFDLH